MLEEDACFNAGRGSVLTEQGRSRARRRDHGRPHAPRGRGRGHHDDARADQPRAAADGAWPARLPVRRSGADRFRRASAGSSRSPNDLFDVPERRRQLDEALAAGSVDDPIKYGTIGAVAVDFDGHVAAATSTGGHDRQALGPGRRFAADRRRHLRRRPLRPRFRRPAPANISSAPSPRTSWPSACGSAASRCRRRSTRCSPTLRRSAARAG